MRQDGESDGNDDFEGEAVSFPVFENTEPGKDDAHRPDKSEQIHGKEKDEEVLLPEGEEKLGGVEDTEEACSDGFENAGPLFCAADDADDGHDDLGDQENDRDDSEGLVQRNTGEEE